MRFTHENQHRNFKIPLGPWIFPMCGAMLCLLFLANTTKATAIRFAVWTLIGQIVYFGYSYQSSKLGKARRLAMNQNNHELMPRIDAYVLDNTQGFNLPESGIQWNGSSS
jgi:amino acid transporter